MEIAIAIQIHLLVVVASIIVGFFNFILTKGTRLHKANGQLWVGLMLMASVSSFFIMPTGHHTWLHLLAIVVIVSVIIGVIAIRQENKRLHIGCMLGSYVGTVVSAAIAASVPGRLLNNLLF